MPSNYDVVIGLEVHVRLSLDSKLFSSDRNEFGARPNTLVSEVSLAYPGTLPVLNTKAVEMAIKMGLACKCRIARTVDFDRKNYFYPDLPKAFQLTQDRNPICKGGLVKISLGEHFTDVILTKIHIEEDAGKLIHDENQFSLVDFNRAGTGLLEVVTEPCLQSPEEAHAFMFEIRRIVRAIGISNGNMEEGSLRCDANVSLRKPGVSELGPKVEIKNLNSFNFVKRALNEEIQRQLKRMEAGQSVISETRDFDPVTGRTTGMRTKESLTDYRYFPEPDLPPVTVNSAMVSTLRDQIPELPVEKQQRYQQDLSITPMDAAILTESTGMSAYFEALLKSGLDPPVAANWLKGPVRSYLKDKGIEIDHYPLPSSHLAQLIRPVQEGRLPYHIASKSLLSQLTNNPSMDVEALVAAQSRLEVDHENTIEIARRVISAHPKEADLYRKGKKQLLGMFMGKMMKETDGKADPSVARASLLECLES